MNGRCYDCGAFCYSEEEGGDTREVEPGQHEPICSACDAAWLAEGRRLAREYAAEKFVADRYEAWAAKADEVRS